MAFLTDNDIFLHHGAHCKLSVNFQVEEYRLCFVVSTNVQSHSSPARDVNIQV